ncbi:hypothetical protein BX600DRAFT_198819 [Xylariales sp. PMI_506]|nr:hypothetical protein BX600DRAFT_198819 [Xylariales sp. PMI_506]
MPFDQHHAPPFPSDGTLDNQLSSSPMDVDFSIDASLPSPADPRSACSESSPNMARSTTQSQPFSPASSTGTPSGSPSGSFCLSTGSVSNPLFSRSENGARTTQSMAGWPMAPISATSAIAPAVTPPTPPLTPLPRAQRHHHIHSNPLQRIPAPSKFSFPRTERTNPALATKLRQMAMPLAPLVQLTTGLVHPAFPTTLLRFWLLTDGELESLAVFYHQAGAAGRGLDPVARRWAAHYPCPIQWDSRAPIEVKRALIGRFIGLRNCCFDGLNAAAAAALPGLSLPVRSVAPTPATVGGFPAAGVDWRRSRGRLLRRRQQHQLSRMARGDQGSSHEVAPHSENESTQQADAMMIDSNLLTEDEIMEETRRAVREREEEEEMWRRKMPWYN